MAKTHRPVQVLIKPASADCNLDCKYCFYLKKASLYPETKVHRMSHEVQEQLVRQMMRYGGPQPGFSFQGGEPTLMGLDWYKRLVALQEEYAAPGMAVSNALQTNGILLDDAWCDFLARYKFLVGLSLDGPPELHDAHRLDRGARPTHERVRAAAELMRGYGVEFNILCVVSAHSAGRGREVYQYIRSLGVDYMQFIPTVEFGPDGSLAPWSVDPLDYGRFICDVHDAWLEDWRNGRPTTSVRLFETILHAYVGLATPSCIFRKRCGIYVVVEHNGDVYSCDFFVEPEWKLGNLTEHNLRTLLEGPRQKEFGDLKMDLPQKCQECAWRWVCNGGCTKDRMRSGLPGERGLDYFCEGYLMIFEHTRGTFEKLARVVQAENPELAARASGAPSRKKKKKGKRK